MWCFKNTCLFIKMLFYHLMILLYMFRYKKTRRSSYNALYWYNLNCKRLRFRPNFIKPSQRPWRELLNDNKKVIILERFRWCMIFAAISTPVTLLGPLSNGPSLPAITERVVHHPSRRLRCRARKFTESLSQEKEEEVASEGIKTPDYRFYLTEIRDE